MVRFFLAALGCYGLSLGMASAQQWSAESCKNLEQVKADIYATNSIHIAWQLDPILKFQQAKCGVDITSDLETLKRAMTKAQNPSDIPDLCRVTPMPDGGGSTQCR